MKIVRHGNSIYTQLFTSSGCVCSKPYFIFAPFDQFIVCYVQSSLILCVYVKFLMYKQQINDLYSSNITPESSITRSFRKSRVVVYAFFNFSQDICFHFTKHRKCYCYAKMKCCTFSGVLLIIHTKKNLSQQQRNYCKREHKSERIQGINVFSELISNNLNSDLLETTSEYISEMYSDCAVSQQSAECASAIIRPIARSDFCTLQTKRVLHFFQSYEPIIPDLFQN